MADYPISNVPRRVQYVNSGVGPYAFTFEVLVQTDIAVYRGSTLLTLTTDYAVTINANGTGSITLVTAGTGNITIVGARAIQRSSDYTTGGDLFASTLNTDLDSQTIYSQQLAESLNRTIKVPVTDASTLNLQLPNSTSRANKLFGFTASGEPTVSSTTVSQLDAAVSSFVNNTGNNSSSIIYDPAGSSAVATTVQTKLRETVSVKDFGAVGDGVADDTTAIQAAINYIGNIGGGTVYIPAGTYLISATLTVVSGQDNVRITGAGSGSTIFKRNGSFRFFRINTVTNGIDETQGNTLASNAAKGTTTITLTTGKGANITPKTWVVIRSEAAAEGGPNITTKQGNFIFVEDVVGDVLTISSPLLNTYTTANSSEICNTNLVNGFELSGVGFDGNNYFFSGSINTANAIEIYWAYRPYINDIKAWELPNVFLALTGCISTQISDVYGYDFLSTGYNGATNGFGYGVVELALNQGLTATNLTFDRVRHAYTTAALNFFYGVPTGSRISNSTAMNCRGAGFDTHPEGRDVGFTNCSVIGCLQHGFQIRSVDTIISNCSVDSCLATGLYLTVDSIGTVVENVKISNTNYAIVQGEDWRNRGAIFDAGEKNKVYGASISECGGQGLSLSGTSDFGYYKNIVIRNPNLDTAQDYGVSVPGGGPTRLVFDSVYVEDYNGNLYNGFYISCSTITSCVIKDFSCFGNSNRPIDSVATPNVIISNSFGPFLNCPTSIAEKKTLDASGFLRVDDAVSSWISVEGEGGVADTLTRLINNYAGQKITLRLFSTGSPITVEHNSFIRLAGSADFVMSDANDTITLLSTGTENNIWVEYTRTKI